MFLPKIAMKVFISLLGLVDTVNGKAKFTNTFKDLVARRFEY
jgi:hypothetical protein